MAISERDLQGKSRCFLRRKRKIELNEGDVKAYRPFAFNKRIVRNWFRSKELRNEEPKIQEAIRLILAGTAEEDVPEDMLHVYKTVRSILITDGEFDLWTPDFDPKKAELVVKLASRKRYLPDMVERNYIDGKMGFETMRTAEVNAAESLKNILRYIEEEERTMIWPDTPYPVNLFGMMVETYPHAIYINEREREIEVIKYSAGKPNLSFSSKKEDSAVNTSLRLFALWKLGKSLIPDRNGWTIKASFYFLRKPNDSKKWEGGYFESPAKNSPIRTLEEQNVYTDVVSATEALFEPQVEAYRIGRECNDNDCNECDLKAICKFNLAPLQNETPRKPKSITDLDLSESQEDAIYFREGILRVNAGAGAGKTMVVALRTALMLSEGILPEDILLITFTEAAAAEMRERVAMYCEDLEVEADLTKLGCMTFNAFGNEIIKTEYDQFGFLTPPRLIDEIERKDIILKLMSDHNIAGIDYRNVLMDMPNAKGGLAVVSKGFDTIKKLRLSSYDKDEFIKAMSEYSNWIKGKRAYQQILDLFEIYDNELKARNLIEFADQEKLIFELLDVDPYYFDKLAYRHITVDEFQDSSPTQLELVKQLVEANSFESLMIVGDDSQSIYSFRNADPSVFLDFYNKIGQVGKDIQIVYNHRSTPEILDFANKLNELNKNRLDKDLMATRDPGKPVEVKGFYTKDAEYTYITEMIQKKIDEGHRLEDIAVITKTNSELAEISGYLADAGIESAIKAPLPMLENSRVSAMVSLAKAYRNVNATQHVLNIENCLLGGKALELTDDEIEELIEKGQERLTSLKALREPKRVAEFDALVKEIVGDDEIAQKLVDSIDRFYITEDKVSYIEKFAKFGGEKVKKEGKYSGVILSTAHSSKGLEYPIVFNSISKYDNKSINTEDKCEEARRLFFVSATRARDELYVTSVYRKCGNRTDGYQYNRYIQEALKIAGKKYGEDYWLEDPDKDEKKSSKIKEAKERIAKENAETEISEESRKAEAAKKLPKKAVAKTKKIS